MGWPESFVFGDLSGDVSWISLCVISGNTVKMAKLRQAETFRYFLLFMLQLIFSLNYAS